MSVLALEQNYSANEKRRSGVASTMAMGGHHAAPQRIGLNQYFTHAADPHVLDGLVTQYITTNKPVFQHICHGGTADLLRSMNSLRSDVDVINAYASALAELDATVRSIGLMNRQLFTAVLMDRAFPVPTASAVPVTATKSERTRAPKALRDVTEQLLTELGRLRDGWDGEGGCAPSNATLRAMAKLLLSVLPQDAPVPDADVDGSDGSVTLRWYAETGDSVFSISVSGRRVTAISTSRSASQTWDADIEHAFKLVRVAADHIRRV